MLIPFLKSIFLVQFVSILNMLFALFVVAPLVVAFWSTTWKIYDQFLLPNEPTLSGTVSFMFGCCGQVVLMFHQDSIKKLLNFEKLKFVNVLLLKIYALFLGHTFVSFWRGVWCFVDATSSNDLGVVILNIIQNIIVLMILRVFRNTLVPPFIVLTDSEDQYNMRTVLEKSKANGSFTYFIDCLTTMFVEVLVAFIWHDFWFIHDTNIFPDNLVLSASTSLLIGYSLAVICFSVQSFVGILCEKYDDKRVFIYEFFTTFCLLSAINVWRGVWTFVTYFAGDDIKWNLILNTIAWALLMTLNLTFSLSAKDILKDAEISGKNCTKFQTEYFVKLLPQETDIKSEKV